MDYHLMLTSLIVAVVALLAGFLLHGWMAKQAPSKLVATVEADAVEMLTKGLELLADTTGEDKLIAAATNRKAQRALLFSQAVANVQAQAAKAGVSAS